ncbi:MAG TPA: biopolymer transporter ExbD [Pirellulales bacterium]|jgi:biopolymer transport protein ExbD|nr:biopolymer transporter ExbD [Pirellulales bacterium]
MSASVSKSARAQPNLTPILDMVFQLITFFILVTNFKTNEIDRHMELPAVGTARPVKADGLLLLMVNINDRGQFTVFNKPQTDEQMAGYIESHAEADRMAARRMDRNFTGGKDLPTTVVIRADRNTPFQKLHDALLLCHANHYRNFVFRTAIGGRAAGAAAD